MPIGAFRLNTISAALAAAGPSYVSATGGTETYFLSSTGPMKVHSFIAAGDYSLVVSTGGTADILAVGGGGAGGGASTTVSAGGGGGAGVYRLLESQTLSAGTYNIHVGAGGTGVSAAQGNAGGYTEVVNPSAASVVYAGGGGRGSVNGVATANSEGPGAGSGASSTTSYAGGTGTVSNGFAGNTYQGGSSFGSSTTAARAGGGGAGWVTKGVNAATSQGGNGGNGISSAFDGVSQYYSTGGGGGGAAIGYAGGGTASGNGATNGTGQTCSDAHGGGGGGARNSATTARAGGGGMRGCVRFRYPSTTRPAGTLATQNSGGTGSFTASASGGPFSNGGWTSSNVGISNWICKVFTSGFVNNRIGNGGYPGTMEFWFKSPSTTSSQYFQFAGFQAYGANSPSKMGFFYSSAGSAGMALWNSTGTYPEDGAISIGSMDANTWYHIAISTDGNQNWYMWRDGTYITSFTNGSLFYGFYMGSAGFSNNSNTNTVQYSNLRWSNIQRYTAGSNFTKPTARFNNDANTYYLFRGADNNDTTS